MSNAPPPRAITPAARLRGLRPYAPEPADTTIDLRLDANEGVQPGPDVLDALQAITPEQLRRYPNAAPLESELAASFGVDPSHIVVTNGGDDAIDRGCRAVLEPGRDLLTHAPGFVMIPRSARLAGADIRQIVWVDEALPEAELTSHLGTKTGLVALVTPNNPTGRVIDTPTILRIARAAAEMGSLVLVDLAYIEFADKAPTPRLLDEPNIEMLRTMSKAAGLAGARVGYAVAQTEIADWLRTVGAPFPVSSASLALAAEASKRRQQRAVFIDSVRRQRTSLHDLLTELGGQPIESQANFVMSRFDNAAFVHRELAHAGILVRRIAGSDAEAGYLRITLPGTDAEFDRLCDALRKVLATAASTLPDTPEGRKP